MQAVARKVLKNRVFRRQISDPMNKNLLSAYWKWIILAGALLLALGWWLMSRRNLLALDAVPSQTVLVTEFNGLAKAGQLVTEHPDADWKAILQSTLLEACWQDAALAAQLFKHDEALHADFASRRLVAALTLNPADSLHPLLVLDMHGACNLESLLKSSPVSQKFFPTTFHGHTLYTVYFSKKERLVVASEKNLLLCSRFSYLIEDALAQLDKGDSWWSDAEWQGRVDDDAPLKFSFRPLSGPLAVYLNPSWRSLPERLEKNIRWAGISWDGTQTRSALKTAGFLEQLGRASDAASPGLFAVCPENTALLAASRVSQRSAYGDLFSNGAADFQQFILPWLGQEAAFALTEPFSTDLKEEQFLILSVSDAGVARQRLEAYAAQRGQLRQYDYQTFTIRHFLSASALSPLLDSKEPAFVNPACAAVGDYIVFATSTSALELWIDKYVVNQTLVNSPEFLLQRQKIVQSGPLSLFFNAAYLPQLLKRLLQERPAYQAADGAALLARTGMTGLDLRPGARTGWLDATPGTQSSGAAPTAASGSMILWKTPLAAPAATRPSVVTRASDNETFICIQDSQNVLYCLRSNGSVAWRRNFDKRLLSDVQGIDFRNNGACCFLFNTPTHIWLLDEERHDVEGFPVKLQSVATNGLSVVDFDDNRRYSFFVACANGNIYGYDQYARPLPGWNPQGGVGRVEQPVLHFEREDKDYLVALSRTGRLSVFGRDGGVRFAPQWEGKFAGPPQADAESRSPRIAAVNTQGKVYVCALDGQVFSLALAPAAEANARAQLVFAPLSGDNRFDYAVLKGKNLKIAAYAGAQMTTQAQLKFDAAPDTLFALADNHLGALVRSKRQIFLLDQSGKIHPDFPLAGDTPFVFGHLFEGRREQVLVVGNGASVYAYKVR